jgi:hypothetical protein
MNTVVGVLLLIFATSCVAMHFIQPELSPAHDAVSFYMTGRHGWILGAGLEALGFASVLIAFMMRRAGIVTAGRVLFWLWTTGVIVGGLFPPDPIGSWNNPPSMSGMLHSTAAMLAFVCFPVAAVLIAKHARELRLTSWLCFAATIGFFGCLFPAFRDRPPVMLGLSERIALALYVVWLFKVARLLTSRAPS